MSEGHLSNPVCCHLGAIWVTEILLTFPQGWLLNQPHCLHGFTWIHLPVICRVRASLSVSGNNRHQSTKGMRCWCWAHWQLLHKARGFPKMMVRAFFLPSEGRMESLDGVRYWKKRKLKAKVLWLASLLTGGNPDRLHWAQILLIA